jgi:hypothetical protein
MYFSSRSRFIRFGIVNLRGLFTFRLSGLIRLRLFTFRFGGSGSNFFPVRLACFAYCLRLRVFFVCTGRIVRDSFFRLRVIRVV